MNNHRKHRSLLGLACVAGLILAGVVSQSIAADQEENPIKHVMATFHKAPKGVDPVCKRAPEGKATADELKNLVAAYKSLETVKPAKGDEGEWKERIGKLVSAAEALEKNEDGAAAKYKEAVNCKACHTAHKPK